MAAASSPSRDEQTEVPGSSLMSYRSLVYQPHTPDVRNRTTERVSGSRRGVDTALTSYSATKQRTRVQLRPRAGTREGKVSLSTLTAVKPEVDLIVGGFMCATTVKSVPLPTLYNHHQATRKGIRNIRIHSDRYLPASAPTFHPPMRDTSSLHDIAARAERNLEMAKNRKASSAHVPHRTEFGFYMSGNSASLYRKGELSREEIQRLQQSSLAPNSALYYGRGVRGSRPQSKAVQDFERKVQAMAKGSDEMCEEGQKNIVRESRPITPAPTPAPPTAAEDSTFITESNS